MMDDIDDNFKHYIPSLYIYEVKGSNIWDKENLTKSSHENELRRGIELKIGGSRI